MATKDSLEIYSMKFSVSIYETVREPMMGDLVNEEFTGPLVICQCPRQVVTAIQCIKSIKFSIK